MMDQWLTAEQAAEILNIKDTQTIYRAYHEGAFGPMAIQVGKSLRINPAFFQSAQAAARTAAIIELADDVIRQATALKELAASVEPPVARKARRRSLNLNGSEPGSPITTQHAGR